MLFVFGGLSPPPPRKLLHSSWFSKLMFTKLLQHYIDKFYSVCFVISVVLLTSLWWTLHLFVIIEIFLVIQWPKLSYLQFWKYGRGCHKPHPIYDVAHRAPLLKFLEITTAIRLCWQSSSVWHQWFTGWETGVARVAGWLCGCVVTWLSKWLRDKYLPVCMSACLCVCLTDSLPICCLPTCLSICIPAYLPVCIPVCRYFCMSVCLSVFLSVWLTEWLTNWQDIECLTDWLTDRLTDCQTD